MQSASELLAIKSCVIVKYVCEAKVVKVKCRLGVAIALMVVQQEAVRCDAGSCQVDSSRFECIRQAAGVTDDHCQTQYWLCEYGLRDRPLAFISSVQRPFVECRTLIRS